MTYTVWGKDGVEFTFVEGEQPPPSPPWDAQGMQLLKVFEAGSWDDAMRQYHEWQGWDPYKPMDEE